METGFKWQSSKVCAPLVKTLPATGWGLGFKSTNTERFIKQNITNTHGEVKYSSTDLQHLHLMEVRSHFHA
jgi:hypothetical protein